MERALRGVILSAVVAFVVFHGSPGVCREPVQLDIPRLIQESPGFLDHPGSAGIFWLRDVRYSLGSDGSMERLTTRVILARRGIEDRWTRWEIPVPENGRVEVLNAGLYDPGSGRLLAPVLPRETVRDGIPVVDVLFPDLQEEFIMAFSLREAFPKTFFMDDFLWMHHPLPQWEQRVTVDVPRDLPFVVGSSGVGQFKREKVGDADRYTWVSVNTPAWTDRTLLSGSRGYIAFSMRKGQESLARRLSDIERVSVPEVPKGVKTLLSRGDRNQQVSALMKWLQAAPSLGGGMIPTRVRNPIPSEGPWTLWEKAILLNSWVRAAGWQSRLAWVAAYPFDDEAPATFEAILRPVTELSAKGTDALYADLLQGSFTGENSFSLAGWPLYALDGMRLKALKVSPGSADDNRLSVGWTLGLDETGALSGTVNVYVRKGWSALFFPKNETDEGLVRQLAADLFPFLTYAPGIATVKPIKYGWQVSFPVTLRQSIVDGGAMLVPYPATYPSWLMELARQTEEYATRFPFVAEQEFIIKLPPRTYVVLFPSKLERTLRKVRYQESVTYNKTRHMITGRSQIVLSTGDITSDVAIGLAEAVHRWMAFGTKNLPLRSR